MRNSYKNIRSLFFRFLVQIRNNEKFWSFHVNFSQSQLWIKRFYARNSLFLHSNKVSSISHNIIRKVADLSTLLVMLQLKISGLAAVSWAITMSELFAKNCPLWKVKSFFQSVGFFGYVLPILIELHIKKQASKW